MALILDRRMLAVVGIFVLDAWTPVGTPVWLLYFVPLLFMRSAPHRHLPLILAGACTVCIFVAFLLSPSDPSGSKTLTHRATLVVAIWVAALFMDRPRRPRGARSSGD
jgi:hypothetical protein